MPLQSKDLSKMIGRWIENTDGETIGRVEDIKIDTERGIPEYLIVCCTDMFGETDRYFAIPVHASLINAPARGKLTLNIDKQALQVAIGIPADECPKFNPEIAENAFELYGYEKLGLPE